MSLNLHSSQIPQEIIDQAQTKLNEVNEILKPYLITLTNEQRMTLPKMGEKSLSFVTDANNYSVKNPELLPAFVSREEFDIDLADASNLKRLQLTSDQLATSINDTMLTAGSEAYTAALAFYNNVKLGAKQNVSGAKDIFNALKSRFPGFTRKAEETTK